MSSPAACNAARAPAPRSSSGGSSGGYSRDAMMMGIMGSAMNSFVNGMMQGMEAAERERIARAFARNDQGIELYNKGDLAGAISAFSEAAQYAPGDPNIRENLQKAQQAMAERNRAKLEAARQRVGGMLSGLAAGLDAASTSNTEAALSFEAPAGTSFFGTGGGGAAPSAGGGKDVAPAGRSGTPRYSETAPPPPDQTPLDFVGMNEPLFQKGSQYSAPVQLDGAKRPLETLTASPTSAPRVPAQRGGPIASAEVPVPDTISYTSTGLSAWLSSKFMDAASSNIAATAARGEERIPEPATAAPKPPPLPLETSSIRNPTEFGARALANTAFLLAGAGDLKTAEELLDKAITYAPNDARLPEARDMISKAQQERFETGDGALSLFESPNGRVAIMGRAQKVADLAADAARQGRYSDAMRGYEEAYHIDAKPEYFNKAAQAGIGMILSDGGR